MLELKHNQITQTPNGPGVIEGAIYENGCRWIVVRHILKDMIGKSAGQCLTPKAKLSGLWRYEQSELERVQKVPA